MSYDDIVVFVHTYNKIKETQDSSKQFIDESDDEDMEMWKFELEDVIGQLYILNNKIPHLLPVWPFFISRECLTSYVF